MWAGWQNRNNFACSSLCAKCYQLCCALNNTKKPSRAASSYWNVDTTLLEAIQSTLDGIDLNRLGSGAEERTDNRQVLLMMIGSIDELRFYWTAVVLKNLVLSWKEEMKKAWGRRSVVVVDSIQKWMVLLL